MTNGEMTAEMIEMANFLDWLGPWKVVLYLVIVVIIGFLIIPTKEKV